MICNFSFTIFSLIEKYKNTDIESTFSPFLTHILSEKHLSSIDNTSLLHQFTKSNRMELLKYATITKAISDRDLICLNKQL